MSDASLVQALEPTLCADNGCRLLTGHAGKHNCFPATAWNFMERQDRDKLTKAGFATPRGGAKGAYQNHVVRSNRVIIPYQRMNVAPLSEFADYVISLSPDQYFQSSQTPYPEFLTNDSSVRVGENAFVLYRSHASYEALPPLDDWRPRRLLRDGVEVGERRGNNLVDVGHYVLRMPRLGDKAETTEGPPQGIFAPEYADENTNFLCRCVLAWLIVHTHQSPYTTTQAAHLKAILRAEDLRNDDVWEFRGVLRRGLTACPLCTGLIKHRELHEMLVLDDEDGLENAGLQVAGATRSTIVNLFHLEPLRYDRLDHVPMAVAWGHATCNTKLGQRRCFSVGELTRDGDKVGLIKESGIETIGWMSPNWEMIRSPHGAVWIRICSDRGQEHDDAGAVTDPLLGQAVLESDG